MASASLPDVRKILGRLGRLRARIRIIFGTIGVARWVVAAVGLLVLFFLADWLLDLPLSVRQFVRLGLLQPPADMSGLVYVPLLLVSAVLAVVLTRARHGAAPFFAFVLAGLVGLLAWLALRLFFPLSVPLPDQELALTVESRFRHLKDRLAAALDFERELRAPTRGESPEMMRAVVVEAVEEARDLHFSKAVSGGRALRWGGAALLTLVVAGTLAWLFQDTVGLWARRSLLLADEPWPRATTMLAVDLQPDGSVREHDPAQPYAVPIGRSLTVYAQARGALPDEALVLDLVPGQEPLARRMFVVPKQEGVFAYEFRDVRRPFAFVLRGGDDEDDRPRYGVEVTIPPRVLEIRSTISYPEYLGLPDEQVPDGSVTVPEGSRVAVVFEADVEIERAEVALDDETIPATPVDGSGGRGFAFSYEAQRSAQYRIVMRTPDGKANDPAADTYEIRVRPDQAPRVDWIYPRLTVEVTPGGRVPLLARTTDDHGVTALRLEVRVGASETLQHYALEPYRDDADEGGRQRVGPPTATNDGSYGRRGVLTYVPVEIRALRTEALENILPPEELAFRLVATDSRGQARESDWTRVSVGNPAPLERDLASRRANVRLAVEAVRKEQKNRRDEVAQLLEEPLGRPELDLLKSIRFAQGKIAQDADRHVQELFAVFNGFVYDRLGSENPNAKILAFFDGHHRATYGEAPEEDTEPAARDGTRRWKGDPVFPYALYSDIVAAWRDKVIYDKGLLDKMCAVIADAVEVGSLLAPAAQDVAAEAVSGNPEQVRALLAAQDANLEALDRLLDAMNSWQSLSDMTIELRRIIDEQETLIRQMDDDAKKDEQDGDGGDNR